VNRATHNSQSHCRPRIVDLNGLPRTPERKIQNHAEKLIGSAPARDGIAAAALPMSFEVDPLIKGLYPTTGFHLMLPIESR
jgi:hypothetical protein